MTKRPGPTPTSLGMTLIELLIVLVIVAILAAVAWPSFRDAVHKSRRADAMSALTEIMQAQERWRSNNPAYRASFTLPESAPAWRTVSRDGHYALSLTGVTASTYTAAATVASGSAQASDSRCQVLQVRVDGGNITYESKVSSSSVINGPPDPCWAR